MRVISVKKLKVFWQKYCDSEQSLRAWYLEAKKGKWSKPNDIKRLYRSASFLRNNKVVFNIKGNKYRLIVSIKYEYQIIYIRFVGTHTEYDKIDANKI